MEIKHITVQLTEQHSMLLVFRKYSNGGDWICQMSDDTIVDLGALTEENPIPLQISTAQFN